MKIESIEQTLSPSGKLRLRLDKGESMLLMPAVIAQYGLYSGMELSEDLLAQISRDGAKASCKERALRMISQSTVSKNELKYRLTQKGESAEDADAAISWLEELHLLDDKQVAKQIVRSGLSKGYGEARIRQMLYEKRVPKACWQEALEAICDQDDVIDAFLQKRFRGKMPDRAECKRAADALLRRGHSWCDVRRALERYAPDEGFSEE